MAEKKPSKKIEKTAPVAKKAEKKPAKKVTEKKSVAKKVEAKAQPSADEVAFEKWYAKNAESFKAYHRPLKAKLLKAWLAARK